MLGATHGKWAGILTLGAILFTLAGNSSAQPKKLNDKHDAIAIDHTLRDVINAGVKLFNDEGDHVGCYRLYQGSLLTVRPFLAPDMQKTIDAGLAGAEKMPTFAQRAFELRRVLDELRAKIGPGDEKKDEKTPKKDEKVKKSDGENGQVAGKVTFADKPVQGGYFITLVSEQGKKVKTAINNDGTFQFTMPIAVGAYRVTIEPIPEAKRKGTALPARYGSAETSALTVGVKAGKQTVDLNLVKSK